ncbi:hypothetical protein LTR62_006323 [Meristemomyces frigidus]|uniref:Fatty acid desaturase domain-containing protein n=1 Tax=Meristemomyces frigidus TaxID=1508187 RepID=A0AAN7TDN6_9PEZI|nr:hypothetical protein LTR62_006323 [Meristemomyces frigidus]
MAFVTTIDPALTGPDQIVLQNLYQDLHRRTSVRGQDQDSKARNPVPNKEVTQPRSPGVCSPSKARDDTDVTSLKSFNEPSSPAFEPTVFTIWNATDLNPVLDAYVIRPYSRLAQTALRHPTDVVFLTHIILYLSTIVPSAIYLLAPGNFIWSHGVLHTVFTMWCAGPFTLLLHNHIHNNGIFRKDVWWARWADWGFPYVLEPLMGHTWDSYFYHHVKHHHVEGNGPNDLSSTLRYQRDAPLDFAHYFFRFFLLVWYDLPMYFVRTNKHSLAIRAFLSEIISYTFFATMTYYNAKAATFVFLLPFVLLRFGLMVGNWGQHALVDESNRHSFNDGYHTAHHLNPLRHWRDQPSHFLAQKSAYSNGRALVFHDMDYIMLTIRLLSKDYTYIARRFVPINEEQARMNVAEVEQMLKTKTRKFSEQEIRGKFKL